MIFYKSLIVLVTFHMVRQRYNQVVQENDDLKNFQLFNEFSQLYNILYVNAILYAVYVFFSGFYYISIFKYSIFFVLNFALLKGYEMFYWNQKYQKMKENFMDKWMISKSSNFERNQFMMDVYIYVAQKVKCDISIDASTVSLLKFFNEYIPSIVNNYNIEFEPLNFRKLPQKPLSQFSDKVKLVGDVGLTYLETQTLPEDKKQVLINSIDSI